MGSVLDNDLERYYPGMVAEGPELESPLFSIGEFRKLDVLQTYPVETIRFRGGNLTDANAALAARSVFRDGSTH
jgi:hypothetical protein